MIIGHESAGTVVNIGDGVDRNKVGELVALEPGVRAEPARNACGAATTYVRRSISSPRRLWTARSAAMWPLTPPSPIPPRRG